MVLSSNHKDQESKLVKFMSNVEIVDMLKMLMSDLDYKELIFHLFVIW